MAKLTRLQQNEFALKEIQEALEWVKVGDSKYHRLKGIEMELIEEINAVSRATTPIYKDIIGKQIVFVDGYEMEHLGFIAGADPAIGLTVKPLGDDDDAEYLFCAVVKSPDDRVGVALFWHIVDLIRQSNRVTKSELDKIVREVTGISPGYGGSCPFSK